MNNLLEKQINEVVEIKHMFKHLQESAKQTGMPLDPFKFFGFHETTIHYHIYRMMKLSEKELENKWRYRDKDVKGLERCLAMLNAYEIIVNQEDRKAMTALDTETLDFMVDVSNLHQSKAA